MIKTDEVERLIKRCQVGCGGRNALDDAHSILAECYGKLGVMLQSHIRYETARRMNPKQWAEAWKLNLSTGKPFDEIIDDLTPFMFPDASK